MKEHDELLWRPKDLDCCYYLVNTVHERGEGFLGCEEFWLPSGSKEG